MNFDKRGKVAKEGGGNNVGRKSQHEEIELGQIPFKKQPLQMQPLPEKRIEPFQIEGPPLALPKKREIHLDEFPEKSAEQLRAENMKKMGGEIKDARRAPISGANEKLADLSAVMRDVRTDYTIERPMDRKFFLTRWAVAGGKGIKDFNYTKAAVTHLVPGSGNTLNAREARQQFNVAGQLEEDKQKYDPLVHPLMDREIRKAQQKVAQKTVGTFSTIAGSVSEGVSKLVGLVVDGSRKKRVAASKELKLLNEPMPTRTSAMKPKQESGEMSDWSKNQLHRTHAATALDKHLSHLAEHDPVAREKVMGTLNAKVFTGGGVNEEFQHHVDVLKDVAKKRGLEGKFDASTIRPSTIKGQVRSEEAMRRLKPNRDG